MAILFLLIGIVLAFSISVTLLLDQKKESEIRIEKYTDDVNILFEEEKE